MYRFACKISQNFWGIGLPRRENRETEGREGKGSFEASVAKSHVDYARV